MALCARLVKARVLALVLGVPWGILLLIAEPDKPERFFWLWPVQVVLLTGLATTLAARSRRHFVRIARWAAPLALVLLLVSAPMLAHLQSWFRTGWAGPDAEEVQVADALGSYLKARGIDRTEIGYETFIYPFMANYHAIDPTYKVGAEFDLLLRDRYGITNLNQCAEGVSSSDDYRVVQVEPQSEADAPRNYFDVERDSTFQTLGRVGSYDILARE
jgi:hypothetical protein